MYLVECVIEKSVAPNRRSKPRVLVRLIVKGFLKSGEAMCVDCHFDRNDSLEAIC